MLVALLFTLVTMSACSDEVPTTDEATQCIREKHSEKQIFVIGGAKETSGLDAKRAILEGSMAAREIGV